MSYEILISVSLGDNLPLQEEFLSRACKTTAILEAKLNEEVLQSDPILIDSVNPELATELGFRLNKKDFQQFRIERKSIKLQCFVDYSTLEERHFIGYVVLQIRDIQECRLSSSAEPKYRWHVLLNPKYKGSSTKRPQLYLAFMVNRLNESADELMSSSMTNSKTSIGGGGLSLSESHHEYLESAFIRPLRKEPSPAMSSSVHGFPLDDTSSTSAVHEFDSNLKVKLKSRTFYVWDENRCREADCTQMYLIQIQIDKPRHLANLLGEKNKDEDDKSITTEYHFKYTMLGKQIRSASFFDLATAADFRRHRFLFPILTYDGRMLQEYFESYPTVEIRLCASLRNASLVIGFVTTNLLRLFENSSAAIEGDYMIVPEDESVYVKEPFPVVQLKLAISRMDHHQQQYSQPRTPSVLSGRKEVEEDQVQRSTPTPTPSDELSSKTTKDCHNQNKPPPPAQHHLPRSPLLPAEAANQPVNHYYISIDLRTIRLITTNEHSNSPITSSSPINNSSTCQQTLVLFQPFYLQFSYAFFGISDYIKTYPSIRFSSAHPLEAITIPHGFCGFNFATTREKLQYTFATIPFIVTLHLEIDDTLLGTAKLDLSCLLKKNTELKELQQTTTDHPLHQNQLGDDQFVNTTVQVEDELNDQICEIQVVMFLQEMTNLSYCADDQVQVAGSRLRAIIPSMQAEGEEVGASDQLKFVNQSLNDMIIETAHDIELWKEKQMRIFKSRLKLKEQQILGNSKQMQEMDARLQTLAERERLLAEREAEVAVRQQELDGRFHSLSAEIEAATHEVRLQYEEKAAHERTALKTIEVEKHRLQERLYLLERKLKERELKIRDLEGMAAAGGRQAIGGLRGGVGGGAVSGQPQQRRALSAQRPSSLTRSAVSCGSDNNGTGTRRIVITRDTSTPPLSKSMIEQSSGATKPAFGETRIVSPAMHHRRTAAAAKPPPPLKPVKAVSTNRNFSIPGTHLPPTMISDFPPQLNSRNSTTDAPPTPPLIIEKIKKERQELLKRGVPLKDPLIVEIDKRIRNYRPVNVKRI